VLAAAGKVHGTFRAEPGDWLCLLRYLGDWYRSLQSAEEKIAAMPEGEGLVIWGGGAHTEFLYHFTSLFHNLKYQRYRIVDSDSVKQGKSWRGLPIEAPTMLRAIDWSTCHLLISSYGGQESIENAASSFEVPEERVIKLYDSIRRY
jgi:hypothetical protein